MHIVTHARAAIRWPGLRPFGVSFLYAGWDIHHGFQLYHSDPSGNYGGWKATTESWGWTEICRQVYTIAIALLFCWHRR